MLMTMPSIPRALAFRPSKTTSKTISTLSPIGPTPMVSKYLKKKLSSSISITATLPVSAPNLQLKGTKIPPVDNARFLGITLDSKLSYLPHITALKTKCNKTLNLLKTLSNTDWGANRPTLLTLYRSLLRSKIDYGCFIYGAARKHYLKQIETIENEALRISLGAYRTTPITSLHVEANELPFHLRCTKVGLSFAIRILSDPQNPSYYPIRIPTFKNLFSLNKRILPPLGIPAATTPHQGQNQSY